MKMVSLLESGIVRGGELLVPHLFQFLVLLAYDTSSLVTIPQVTNYAHVCMLLRTLMNLY